LRVDASFVTSAAGVNDLPRDGLAEIALVGRSNVGKSSLINSLVRQRAARTSAAPGKTRLANIYRVARGSGEPLYLVDLPGYGYARGGPGEFAQLIGDYFRSAPGYAEAAAMGSRGEASALVRAGGGLPRAAAAREARGGATAPVKKVSALLLVDCRHPGLDSDREAWAWLRDAVADAAIVATKIDKLARGQRIRAMRQLESVFEHPVLPVSAVTGEGLDQLWTLIDKLTNNSRSRKLPRSSRPNLLLRATAELPKKARPLPKK
jgi:GTP-binding protein